MSEEQSTRGNLCCLVDDGEQQTIEVRISTLGQFYQMLDPSPDLEKDLNPATVEYLVDTAEEMKNPKEHVHVALYLEESLYQNAELKSRMEKSVSAYFSRQVDILEHKHRMAHKKARRNLVRGLLFVIICVALSVVLTNFVNNPIVYAFGQSLTVIGWVALWTPAEFYLYLNREANEEIATMKRLADATVSSKPLA
ncbi:MAG TPA: hypothetical protein O0X61_00120 [Methanocorpusculum sp.]|nr:hypothetical protein [Methanocorpusculum sp.]